MAATNSLDHLSNRMKLEWYSKLNTEMVPAKNFRRTSIIGTIGMSFVKYPPVVSLALNFLRMRTLMIRVGNFR